MRKLATVFATLCLFVGSLTANATTRYVSPTGGNASPYTSWATAARSISNAVNASAGGDLILVTNGTYVGSVRITKGVTVRSVNGAGVTTISGNYPLQTNRCVFMAHPDAVVDGFKITKGFAKGSDGGGVYIATNGTVRNCFIVSNKVTFGGAGVMCKGGGKVQSCVISANRGDDFGGGVLCWDGGLVAGCVISGNGVHGGFGGGAYLHGSATIQGCVIVSNTAADQGGGVFLTTGATAENSLITGNAATNFGGGIYCINSTVTRCVISNNWTVTAWPTGQGGGVFMQGAGLVQNSIICNNLGSDRGGGVAVDGNGVIRSSIIRNNIATYYGGGIFFYQAGKAYNCTVVKNTALNYAGGGVHGYYGGNIVSSIVYFNSAGWTAYSNMFNEGTGIAYSNSCTAPMPPGSGNITQNPNFAGNLNACRLRKGSACIDSGRNAGWTRTTFDIYGNPRNLHGTVDIGAVEFGKVVNDYNYDGKSELAVALAVGSGLQWYAVAATGLPVTVNGLVHGSSSAVPVAMDSNADGVSDLATYDAASGTWAMSSVSTNPPYIFTTTWGFNGTVPVAGNYDLNAGDDLALYDPAAGKWYILSGLASVTPAVLANGLPWGFTGCAPVAGDYDGDGIADLAVYHAASGKWYVRTLSGKTLAFGLGWGFAGTVAVPGDYDGDGLDDLAVYDPPTGKWYIRRFGGIQILFGIAWGGGSCVPITGDYDGDGIDDLSVYDPTTAKWYVRTFKGKVLVNGTVWGATALPTQPVKR